MSIANQYNLFFSIYDHSGVNVPTIGTPTINGRSVNHEIASFLEPNGVRLIQHIKNEINDLDYSIPIDRYEIFGYHDAEYAEIRNFPQNPPIIVFQKGSQEVIVPVNDFLQILEEWKAFVQSVPTPHWLENR